MFRPNRLLYHVPVPTRTVAPSSKSKEEKERTGAIRRQLQRILESRTFRQGDRLQRFLSFIVEETLEGRGDRLKEYPVGVDVFGKDSSFDPRMDPIVRVQARRLRMRLVTYYRDEGRGDEICIELPKGGYAPTFRKGENAAPLKALAPALLGRNTVAVLPFTDQSPESSEAALCAALTQEVTHQLLKEDSIITASPLAADSNGVSRAALVVSGSVRRSRNLLRITTHITDNARGCYIWSDLRDQAPDDSFALQEEVAASVVARLRAEIGKEQEISLERRSHTRNLHAQSMYLQGRYHLNQRTEPGLRKAMEFFGKAIEEDPRFAEAYAGIADAQNLFAHYGVSAPAEVWTKAATNAAQAVLEDDNSSEAHTSLGHVKATQDWDWAGAEREFRRALELNPRNATAHHWFAVSCLAPLSRLDEGFEHILTAQALDPLSSIISRDIALIYYYQRKYDLALEQCDHTIEQNPHFSAAYWTLGLVQEQRGEFEEAIAAFQRAIELSPPSPRILGALGRTYAKAKRRDEALGILHELDQLSKRRYISPFELSLIYFALKRTDEGFEQLSKAYHDRSFELIAIRIDPRFDSVRDDPRFVELFQKLGLQ